jgi:hypothetical protein
MLLRLRCMPVPWVVRETDMRCGWRHAWIERSSSKSLGKKMEITRLGIVYFHLIACCVALGLVLTSDIAMVNKLFKGESDGAQDRQHLASLQRTVSLALAALWATGAVIVAIDVADKGMDYFANPKLQAKIGLVVLLTINGVLLHQRVLPLMQKAGSLLNMQFKHRLLALFAGTVSGVTWFYAALMGVGRPLSWKYSLWQLLAAYPVMILGGFFAMLTLTAWAQVRPQEKRAFAETMLFAR